MPEKKIGIDERKEKEMRVGMLVVITGLPASGKDVLMDEFMKQEFAKFLNLQQVITNTDRKIRDGESVNSYHFVSREELDRMGRDKELVEEIVPTGISRKATSKAEIERLLAGENLIWRVDPSLAAKIAIGKFFKEQFPEYSEILQIKTLIACINTPKEVLIARRKHREGENYNPENFRLRDEFEVPHLKILSETAIVIDNPDGQLTKTVETFTQIVKNHHAKIKNQKI